MRDFCDWKVETESYTNYFSIETATKQDIDAIQAVAKDAYFDEKIRLYTHRKPEARDIYNVTNGLISRRFTDEHAHKYHVLVCKVQQIAKNCLYHAADEIEKTVVGTVYYQSKSTDFVDEQERAIGELGLLAIHPDWQKKEKNGGMSSKLIDTIVDLAEKDRMRAVYIYAIGTRLDDGTYSNGLLKYYDNKGFKFVSNRKSSKPDTTLYTTDDGLVDMVLMVKKLNNETSLKTIKATNGSGLTYQIS